MVPIVFWLLLRSVLSEQQDFQKQKYDYIVVGAGASGCVLASRLTEDNFASVLLLEAGSKPNFFSEIPITAPKLKQGVGNFAWHYNTGKQSVGFRGSINETGLYTAGNILGGGTGINGMLYCRGGAVDYELWEKMGATGWGYDDVLPLYKKLEDFLVKGEDFLVEGVEIDTAYHGTNGPVTVSTPRYTSSLKKAYFEAALEMGFKINDYNGETLQGFSGFQSTTRDGFRCSTERAYLQPAYNRSNLRVLTKAYVTKIKIDAKLVARGVHFTMDNKSYYVKAQKEVIVSAGSIRSPQILMLSGIGPKSELDRFGIEQKIELPVGQSYQDHVAAFGPIFTVNITDRLSSNEIKKIVIPENVSYPLDGILASPGLNEAIAFIKSENELIPGDYPDVEFTIGFLDYNSNFKENINKYIEPYLDRVAFKIDVTNNHPITRGHVSLTSADPFAFPQINYDFLSDANRTDLKSLVDGLKLANQFGRTKALKKFGAEPIPDPIPGCEMYDMLSDKYFECYAILLTQSWNHGIGTCKMGDPNNENVVVDPSLRVKGVSRLRVIDASIMPITLSSNLMAGVILIGEKGADTIKRESGIAPSPSNTKEPVRADYIKELALLHSQGNDV